MTYLVGIFMLNPLGWVVQSVGRGGEVGPSLFSHEYSHSVREYRRSYALTVAGLDRSCRHRLRCRLGRGCLVSVRVERTNQKSQEQEDDDQVEQPRPAHLVV